MTGRALALASVLLLLCVCLGAVLPVSGNILAIDLAQEEGSKNILVTANTPLHQSFVAPTSNKLAAVGIMAIVEDPVVVTITVKANLGGPSLAEGSITQEGLNPPGLLGLTVNFVGRPDSIVAGATYFISVSVASNSTKVVWGDNDPYPLGQMLSGDINDRDMVFYLFTEILACDPGEYFIASSVCRRRADCFAGTYIDAPHTTSTDRLCNMCQGGFTSSSNQDMCSSFSSCATTEIEVFPPTPTSDRFCKQCSPGQYVDTTQQSLPCLTCSSCSNTQYLAESCQGTSDTDCRECALACDADQFYVGSCGSGSSAPVCENCHEGCLSCTSAKATTCTDCKSAYSFVSVSTFEGRCCPRSCGAGFRISVACTADSPIGCEACVLGQDFSELGDSSSCTLLQTCPPGTFVSVQPSLSSDRECAPCYRGQFSSNPNQNECEMHSACEPNQYMEAPGTFTSDTDCEFYVPCGPDQFVVAQPTPTSNTNCSTLSNCEAGTYISSPSTGTSDVECTNCDPFSYTEIPNQLACTEYQPCNSTSHYMIHPATPTSDFVCAELTECNLANGPFEVVPPTTTSDRDCSFVDPNCRDFDEDSPSCVRCEPGYFLTGVGCQLCPVGHFCDGMSVNPCQRGRYQSRTGQALCLTCPAGTFNTFDASSTCTACEPGTYQFQQGSILCDVIPEGYYGLIDDTPLEAHPDLASVGASDKLPCLPGSACRGGMSEECLAGSHAPAPMATECIPCGPYAYSSNNGQSACIEISPGRYGIVAPIDLVPATVANRSLYLVDAASCVRGHYCVDGQQLACPAGTYQPDAGRVSCFACGLGRYQPDTAAISSTQCLTIAFGHYGVGGTPQTRTGQVICPAGSFCIGGEVSPCNPGTFQAEPGQDNCDLCSIQCPEGSEVSSENPCNPVTGDTICIDVMPPTIVIRSLRVVEAEYGTTPPEVDIFCTDSLDGARPITVTMEVNITTLGLQREVFACTDVAGNTASTFRDVDIVDTTPPEITLLGESPVYVSQFDAYEDASVTVTDIVDPNPIVSMSGRVDVSRIGSYTLRYTAIDFSENDSFEERTVIVIDADREAIAFRAAIDAYTQIVEAGFDEEDALSQAMQAYRDAGGERPPDQAAADAQAAYDSGLTQGSEGSGADMLFLIVGAAAGAVLLIAIIVVLICCRSAICCCCSGPRNAGKNRVGFQPDSIDNPMFMHSNGAPLNEMVSVETLMRETISEGALPPSLSEIASGRGIFSNKPPQPNARPTMPFANANEYAEPSSSSTDGTYDVVEEGTTARYEKETFSEDGYVEPVVRSKTNEATKRAQAVKEGQVTAGSTYDVVQEGNAPRYQKETISGDGYVEPVVRGAERAAPITNPISEYVEPRADRDTQGEYVETGSFVSSQSEPISEYVDPREEHGDGDDGEYEDVREDENDLLAKSSGYQPISEYVDPREDAEQEYEVVSEGNGPAPELLPRSNGSGVLANTRLKREATYDEVHDNTAPRYVKESLSADGYVEPVVRPTARPPSDDITSEGTSAADDSNAPPPRPPPLRLTMSEGDRSSVVDVEAPPALPPPRVHRSVKVLETKGRPKNGQDGSKQKQKQGSKLPSVKELASTNTRATDGNDADHGAAEYRTDADAALRVSRETEAIWFQPSMDRNATQQYIASLHPGAFVVRKSSKGGSYALSVRGSGTSMWNGLIIKTENGYRLDDTERTFDSIIDLVAHALTEEGAEQLKIPFALVAPKDDC